MKTSDALWHQVANDQVCNILDVNDRLNPFRVELKPYHLVHCKDTQNCPRRVTRCELCKIVFTNADLVIVRTKAQREFICPKTRKEKCHYANVYLHYLKNC